MIHIFSAVGQCSCFGDPHCLSYDENRLDFQGHCQYVLTRDKCENIEDTPTFEVLSTFAGQGYLTVAPATWVDQVIVNIYNYVCIFTSLKLRECYTARN